MDPRHSKIEDTRNARRWAFRIILGIGFPVALLVGVLRVPLGLVGHGANLVLNSLDPADAVANYEWFRQQAADVASTDGKIQEADNALASFREAAGPRTMMSREDKMEDSRLASIASGLRQARKDMAAQYNARSKMINRALLKSRDLPESL